MNFGRPSLQLSHSRRIRSALHRTGKAFARLLPIIAGMLLLTSLVITAIPHSTVIEVFGHGDLADVLIGAGFGSVVTGHPLASYVLGGELMAMEVSLIAITAFIVSWVTVGVVQLPAESLLLGARYAIYRNLMCFISAIGLAFATVWTLRLLT